MKSQRSWVYQFKNIVRDTGFLFWILIFPMVLAIFFKMAFAGIAHPEENLKIPIAVEKGSFFNTIAPSVDIFTVKDVSPENADRELSSGNIDVFVDKNLNMKVHESGISETVVKGILDQVKQMISMGILPSEINMDKNYFEKNAVGIEPFQLPSLTLSAMACQYSMFSGIYLIVLLLADQSAVGARLSITPMKKISFLGPGIIIIFFLTFISSLILLLFQTFILKTITINQWIPTVILLSLGNLFGVSLGVLIGAALKSKEDSKISAANVYMLGCAFLAGMMSPEIKFAAENKFPFLRYLNPNSLISTELIKINAFGKFSTFWLTCTILLAMAAVTFVISLVYTGRKKYESL